MRSFCTTVEGMAGGIRMKLRMEHCRPRSTVSFALVMCSSAVFAELYDEPGPRLSRPSAARHAGQLSSVLAKLAAHPRRCRSWRGLSSHEHGTKNYSRTMAPSSVTLTRSPPFAATPENGCSPACISLLPIRSIRPRKLFASPIGPTTDSTSKPCRTTHPPRATTADG